MGCNLRSQSVIDGNGSVARSYVSFFLSFSLSLFLLFLDLFSLFSFSFSLSPLLFWMLPIYALTRLSNSPSQGTRRSNPPRLCLSHSKTPSAKRTNRIRSRIPSRHSRPSIRSPSIGWRPSSVLARMPVCWSVFPCLPSSPSSLCPLHMMRKNISISL